MCEEKGRLGDEVRLEYAVVIHGAYLHDTVRIKHARRTSVRDIHSLRDFLRDSYVCSFIVPTCRVLGCFLFLFSISRL